MTKKTIMIFFIIALVMLLIYVITFIGSEDHGPYYSYNNIRTKLKTGDIILFTCNPTSIIEKILYNIRTRLIGSKYGHAGIVILGNNNKLYLLECIPFDHCEKMHSKYCGESVRVINLEKILESYSTKYGGTFAVKFISKSIPNAIVAKHLKKYRNVLFEDSATVCLLAVTDILVSHDLAKDIAAECDPNRMICTEFLHSILRDCNVLKRYPSKLLWPHKFVDGELNKLEITSYSDPVQFVLSN